MNDYLKSAEKQFLYYKMLGDKTFEQLTDEQLYWQYNEESNSIAMIIRHLHGNMLSRWTDFLTTDGEKEFRNRDSEFMAVSGDRQSILTLWEAGWNCLFAAIRELTEQDLDKTVYIRHQGHTVLEAINRQLAHYPYHIGQIVYLGKMLSNEKWKSLSIPKGASNSYNDEKFSLPKQNVHFTDEFLNR